MRVSVTVAVWVAVAVFVGVGVLVGVSVGVWVAVGVAVSVGVKVAVLVGVGVGLRVLVGVGEFVAVGVKLTWGVRVITSGAPDGSTAWGPDTRKAWTTICEVTGGRLTCSVPPVRSVRVAFSSPITLPVRVSQKVKR